MTLAGPSAVADASELGEAVSVVSVDQLRPASGPRRSLGRRPPRQASVGICAATALCIVAPICVGVGAPGAVRVPAVIGFFCIVPGTAFISATRGRREAGLIVGVSLAVTAVAAQSMLWLGVWRPAAMLDALAFVCLLGLVASGLADGHRDLPAAARLRITRSLSGRTACHASVLCVALLVWATSLAGADLERMAGLGLLQALPPTYFVALLLLIIGFAQAAVSRDSNHKLLSAYVIALIVVLHATTALLYDEPRYAWTYKHLGVINLIAATGHVDRQIDIYNNWPAFFAANAWLSKTAGLAPILYAGWAQLFFNLVNVAALRFALRGLTGDERTLWTASFLFVLGNWVAQDYLAPQAFGFALSLIVLGLCLRCGSGRHCDLHAARSVGLRTAIVSGGLCFLAIVTSHQLSPLLLVIDVAALAVLLRVVPLWVPVAMAALEAWWVALAWPFLSAHFALIDPGGGGTAAAGRSLADALPGAALGLYAPSAVMIAMVVLAAVGLVRRWRASRRDLVPVCLIVAPALAVVVQSYGGEGPYRAYLFGLPWLAFLAVFACADTPVPSGPLQLRLPRLLAASATLAAFLLFAYFGQELTNHIPSDDVRAETWYEQHAPAGSLRVNLAPTAPNRLTWRYPLVSLADPPSLLEEPGFSGHRLGARDVRRLEAYIRRQGDHRAYVVLSYGQQNYGRLNGLLPAGSVPGLTAALERSSDFRLTYRRATAWVFQFDPDVRRGAGDRARRRR